ncbi:MAG TPA: hypothetical protein VFA74_19745 [Terriglobales bacterium]|nr:hypothetical protein [Terriglobales bacterium]
MKPTDSWIQAQRLGGLRRFAVAITVFNLLGHTVFGFEQSWAQPLAALITAYACELFVEWIDAITSARKPRFLGSLPRFIDCLLPAHITGLAVAMLLYSSDRLLPVMFAAAVAIASKATIRLTLSGRTRHILNPSNFGITVTLLLFPWVGIAPPYHFTENLPATGSWVLPLIICASGTMVNLRFTRRMPLILAWVIGFFIQAIVRSLLFGTPIIAALNPMTGVAFILFTFYMITDPATSPFGTQGQIMFGFAVAACYGLLVYVHVVFGMFFALTTVSGVRGVVLCMQNFGRSVYLTGVPAHATATATQKPIST